MNEQEWFTATDPAAMLRLTCGFRSCCCGCIWCDNFDDTISLATGQKPCPKCDNSDGETRTRLYSDRKLRLLASAACRDCIPYRVDINGTVWAEQLSQGCDLADLVADGLEELPDPAPAWSCTHRDPVRGVFFAFQDQQLHGNEVTMMRCIMGNPYRPLTLPFEANKWPVQVSVSAAAGSGRFTAIMSTCPWLTRDVIALAHAAYENRLDHGHLDPLRLGVLSDALEDAGCSDAKLLEHLRDPGPHVRGCHVLDLLLGKE